MEVEKFFIFIHTILLFLKRGATLARRPCFTCAHYLRCAGRKAGSLVLPDVADSPDGALTVTLLPRQNGRSSSAPSFAGGGTSSGIPLPFASPVSHVLMRSVSSVIRFTTSVQSSTIFVPALIFFGRGVRSSLLIFVSPCFIQQNDIFSFCLLAITPRVIFLARSTCPIR